MLKVYYCGWGSIRTYPIWNSERKSVYCYTRVVTKIRVSSSWRRSVKKSDPFWRRIPRHQWVKRNYEFVDPCQMASFVVEIVRKLPKRFRKSGYVEMNWTMEDNGRFRVSATYFQNSLDYHSGAGDVPDHFATKWPDRVTQKLLDEHAA